MSQAPRVEGFVADFEKALWQAIRLVFDNPNIKGCVFHWTQAVYRKIVDLGLKVAYCQRDAVFKFVRKLLALPFLPKEHILPTFHTLQSSVENKEKVAALTDYIEDTWMSSTVWPVDSWCVFNMSVRTNNDTEGWHRRVNKKAADGKPPTYVLLTLLYKECMLIPMQVKFVSENKLQRHQRSVTKHVQGRIFSVWERYMKGELSTSGVLKLCGQIYAPRALTE